MILLRARVGEDLREELAQHGAHREDFKNQQGKGRGDYDCTDLM